MENFGKKGVKCIILAAAALLSLAAAITAIVVFKDQISDLFEDVKLRWAEKRACFCRDAEFDNYADV